MAKRVGDILKLGNPLLYKKCEPIKRDELPQVHLWVADLRSAMEDVRNLYNFGRGIAAPQLGIMKRLIYIDLGSPMIIINPKPVYQSPEKFTLWDDCMSFPNLLVKVRRHLSFTITYKDDKWEDKVWETHHGESELIQHEYDHLEGILCTMRAIDEKSFKWKGI